MKCENNLPWGAKIERGRIAIRSERDAGGYLYTVDSIDRPGVTACDLFSTTLYDTGTLVYFCIFEDGRGIILEMEMLQEALSELSEEVQTVESNVSELSEGVQGKVSKSGDEMTGGITLKTLLDLDNLTTSSSSMMHVLDKNRKDMAFIRVDTNTGNGGQNMIQMTAMRVVNNVNKYAQIQCRIDGEGNADYYVTDKAAFRKCLDIDWISFTPTTTGATSFKSHQFSCYYNPGLRLVQFGISCQSNVALSANTLYKVCDIDSSLLPVKYCVGTAMAVVSSKYYQGVVVKGIANNAVQIGGFATSVASGNTIYAYFFWRY